MNTHAFFMQVFIDDVFGLQTHFATIYYPTIFVHYQIVYARTQCECAVWK